jgi:hypothetical protein
MNEELFITFENYLNNEMTPEEQLEFEFQLQNNTEIKEKFELYKETNRFLETKFSSETSDFKTNLKSISQEHFSKNEVTKSKIVNFKPWYYAVAASVAVLFGTWFFMQNSNPQYADYSNPETAMFIERSEGDINLKNAQEAFNSKEYKKAVAAFEKVEDLIHPELQYFHAIALIETNDYTKAQILLETIQSGTSVYKDKATWYLALSNLKQMKFDQCKDYLQQIPADAEDYDKAQELLDELD